MTLWPNGPPPMPEGYHRGLEPMLMAPFVDAMLEAAPPRGRALDIASGAGLVTRRLPADAIGIDAWDEMVLLARRLAPARRYLCADMERLPFRDGAFASVYCSQGLQFAEDLDVALAEARRVGGSFAALAWRDLLASPGFGALHRALLRRLGESPFDGAALALPGRIVRRVVRFPSASAFLVAYVEGSSLIGTVPRLPSALQDALVRDLEAELGVGAISFAVEATLHVE